MVAKQMFRKRQAFDRGTILINTTTTRKEETK
jgi:hypothetical protein